MQQLYTANKEKQRRRKEKLQERRNVFRAEQEKKNVKRLQKQREERKKIFRMMGQAEKRKKRTWFVGKMSVLSYGSDSWWCLSCYVDTVWTSSLLAEISHCKREIIGKSETSAGLRSLLSCWRRPHLSPKLTGFKTGFCLMWNALFLLRLQRLEISEPTVVIAQTGSVSYVARG